MRRDKNSIQALRRGLLHSSTSAQAINKVRKMDRRKSHEAPSGTNGW